MIAKILMTGGEPIFSALPLRLRGSVEIVRAEGAVTVRKQKTSVAELRFERTQGTQGKVSVVAIGLEAGREIAGEGEFFVPETAPERC